MCVCACVRATLCVTHKAKLDSHTVHSWGGGDNEVVLPQQAFFKVVQLVLRQGKVTYFWLLPLYTDLHPTLLGDRKTSQSPVFQGDNHPSVWHMCRLKTDNPACIRVQKNSKRTVSNKRCTICDTECTAFRRRRSVWLVTCDETGAVRAEQGRWGLFLFFLKLFCPNSGEVWPVWQWGEGSPNKRSALCYSNV